MPIFWPENNKVVVKSLAEGKSLLGKAVKEITMLGSSEKVFLRIAKTG